MNEYTGFVTCPNCNMPWGDGQWACPYCHQTKKPAALRRVTGPTWAWLLLGAVLCLGFALDLACGGHVWSVVSKWLAKDA